MTRRTERTTEQPPLHGTDDDDEDEDDDQDDDRDDDEDDVFAKKNNK